MLFSRCEFRAIRCREGRTPHTAHRTPRCGTTVREVNNLQRKQNTGFCVCEYISQFCFIFSLFESRLSAVQRVLIGHNQGPSLSAGSAGHRGSSVLRVAVAHGRLRHFQLPLCSLEIRTLRGSCPPPPHTCERQLSIFSPLL